MLGVYVIVMNICLALTSNVDYDSDYDSNEDGGSCDDNICKYILPRDNILIKESTSHMVHEIDVQNSSSIIFLEVSSENNKPLQGDIIVRIQEHRRKKMWKLGGGKLVVNRTYVSRNSCLNVTFEYKTEWSNVILMYEELTLEVIIDIITNDSGELTNDDIFSNMTKINTLTILQLKPEANTWNSSSIEITIHMIDKCEDYGDFILIGAGNEHMTLSPAAMAIGKITETRTYYIDAEEVYVLLFYISNCNPKFKLSWERTGNKIEIGITDEPIPDSVLQAAEICFYNSSWIQEFNNTDEQNNQLLEFQEKFADVANHYIKKKNIPFIQEISSKKVKLLHVSSLSKPNANLKHGAITVMVTIMDNFDSKTAAFKWNQMNEIVEQFDTHDESEGYHFGFKIGVCSRSNYKYWYVAITLIVLLSTIFFIGVWVVAYKTPWKLKNWMNKVGSGSKNKQNLYTDGDHKMLENFYVTYENPALNLAEEIDISYLKNELNLTVDVETNHDSNMDFNWTLKEPSGDFDVHDNNNKSEEVQTFDMPKPHEKLSGLWKKCPPQMTITVTPIIHNNADTDSVIGSISPEQQESQL